MLFIFADALGTSDYVSGGVASVAVALVAWVLKSALPSLAKQYRNDIFDLQEKHTENVQTQISKNEKTLNALIDRFDKSLDRILANAIEERKESRLNLERELQKRDTTLDKVSEVLKEIVQNVRMLSDEVRTLKQLLPIADLIDPKIKEKLKSIGD